MKNTLMMMFFALALFACNDSKNAENTEMKKEIETTDSVNTVIEETQEDLEETMDAVDDILNTL